MDEFNQADGLAPDGTSSNTNSQTHQCDALNLMMTNLELKLDNCMLQFQVNEQAIKIAQMKLIASITHQSILSCKILIDSNHVHTTTNGTENAHTQTADADSHVTLPTNSGEDYTSDSSWDECILTPATTSTDVPATQQKTEFQGPTEDHHVSIPPKRLFDNIAAMMPTINENKTREPKSTEHMALTTAAAVFSKKLFALATLNMVCCALVCFFDDASLFLVAMCFNLWCFYKYSHAIVSGKSEK
ncbi:hypothetical protein Q7P37_005431 [Cladosporium fusiforme]